MQKIKLLIKKDLNGIKAGKNIVLNATADGLPVDMYWRRRLKDSFFDNCLEVVKEIKETYAKKTKKKIIEDEQ